MWDILAAHRKAKLAYPFSLNKHTQVEHARFFNIGNELFNIMADDWVIDYFIQLEQALLFNPDT